MIEAFSHSCFSLDETQADRNAETPQKSPGPSVLFQYPRMLGKGVDTFDCEGVPQTPVLRVTEPFDSYTSSGADTEAPLFQLDGGAAGTTASMGVGSSSSSSSASQHQHHLQSKRHQQMVLIRGGASFTGAHITVKLLKAGYNVRLLAKDCCSSTAQLKELVKATLPSESTNRLFIFRGEDLMEALVGCDYVVCNSDPETGDLTDPDEIVHKYVEDVEDLFLSIRRVCGGGDHSLSHSHTSFPAQPDLSGNKSKTKKSIRVIWLTTASAVFPVVTTSREKEQLLIYAKSRAMREAERIAKKADISLVVLLTSVVVGPSLTDAKGEAHFVLARIAQGNPWLPFAPKMRWNYVDVRDVADAVCASFTCDDFQRFIISDCELSVSEVGRLLHARFPTFHPATLDMPNMITLLLCNAGFLGERVLYSYLRSNLSRSYVLRNTKAQRGLHMTFRDASEAIVETVHQMLDLVPLSPVMAIPDGGTNNGSGSNLSTCSSNSNLETFSKSTTKIPVIASSLSRASSQFGMSIHHHHQYKHTTSSSSSPSPPWKISNSGAAVIIVSASLVSLSAGFWIGLMAYPS